MNRADIIIIAAGGASVAATTAPILPPGIALYWYCIAGAVLGAIGAAAIPAKEEPTWSQVAKRIVGCAALGGAVSPLLIRWMGWQIDAETVLGVSASLGVLSWLGGRLISEMTPGELREFIVYVFSFGRAGKGDRNDRD